MKAKGITFWNGLGLISGLSLIIVLIVPALKGGSELTKEVVLASVFLGLLTIISIWMSIAGMKGRIQLPNHTQQNK